MKTRLRNRDLSVVLFLAASLLLVFGVWSYSFTSALDGLSQRGKGELRLASDRLTGQLQRYRGLAVLLADHPQILPVLQGQFDPETAAALLLETADKSGALDILILSPEGEALVTARDAAHTRPFSQTSYFQRALDGAMGVAHFVASDYGREERRVFAFAAPVFSGDGPVAGSVVFFVDVAAVEAAWRGAWPAVFFSDDLGVVFVSSRSELLFRSRGTGTVSATADYRETELLPFVGVDARERSGHTLWAVDGGRYLPQEALYLTLDLPVIGMRGEALIDLAPARQIAALQTAVAAALCLAVGALSYLARERRRTLALANQRLEARVADRTSELRTANAALLAEVAERKEAEAALTRTQGELVQAGKLSALGQMSAGISHELNQPLMAIQSFASNATQFLDRDEPVKASDNLGRIAELAGRMGRIIRNLRAFARAEAEPVQTVDLVAAIEAALEVAGPRLRRADVEPHWSRPEAPVFVKGGEVRLQQVVVNLLTNAADAMEGLEDRRIEMNLSATSPVQLTVRDTGPGIADPGKIFDPFYSTKEVGQGMGLGLSISYGLVQGFGGVLRGENHADGGAVFTLELQAAAAEEAA